LSACAADDDSDRRKRRRRKRWRRLRSQRRDLGDSYAGTFTEEEIEALDAYDEYGGDWREAGGRVAPDSLHAEQAVDSAMSLGAEGGPYVRVEFGGYGMEGVALQLPPAARVSLSGLRAFLLERGRMLGRLEAAHPDDLDIALGSHLSGPFEPLRSVSKLSGAVVLRVTASERRETVATRRDESRGRSGAAHVSRGKLRPVPKNKPAARRPRERRVAGARFETIAQHDDDSSSD